MTTATLPVSQPLERDISFESHDFPSDLLSQSDTAVIEEIAVEGFHTKTAFFQRILFEINKPRLSRICHLNVHGANMAKKNPRFLDILQTSDMVFCDGAGIVLGAKLLGQTLPKRHTGADYLTDLVDTLSKAGKTIYFLAGEPEVSEKAKTFFDTNLPEHGIVGMHHGFILNNPDLTDKVVEEINRLKPDILFVGMGMPLQEIWMDNMADRLDVRCIYCIGATLDYYTEKVSRCPKWMGEAGFEWLYRLAIEPVRMFDRYVVGNPWFMSRILLQATKNALMPPRLVISAE